MLGFFLVLGGLVEAVSYWYAVVPLVIALVWSIRWMRQQQSAALHERSQASVSNRR